MPLNKEQQKAVAERNKNLLVSASAGSGKTKVLITRIASMIASKETEISKILVTTFTRLASNEMKTRLVLALTELRESAETEEEKNYLLSQIEDVSVSDISTLHSFCVKMVRKYFSELGIDPGFRLIEDDSLYDFKLRAINKVFKEYSESNDKDFLAVFEAFNEKRNADNLNQAIFKVCEILHKTDENFLDMVNSSFSENVNENSALGYFNNYICDVAENSRTECENFLQNETVSDQAKTRLDSVVTFLESISKNNSFAGNFAVVSSFKFPYAIKDEPEYSNLIKSVKENIKECTSKTFCDCTELDEILKNIQCSKKITLKIIEISRKFEEIFRKIKDDNAVLDLNDIEKLMLKLLENEKIKQQIVSEYDYIFVDEYQDTNPIQEQILTSISNGTNLFMVGDVKQSIYGFRLCDPDIFSAKYAMFKYDGTNTKIDLNYNYRSNKEILEFCNLIFNNIMREQVGKVNYQKDAKFKTEISVNPVSDTPSVQIHIIPKRENIKNTIYLKDTEIYSVKNHKFVEENEEDYLQAEARVVASQILPMINKPIIINENGKTTEKIVKFSDICILSKTKKGYLQKLGSYLARYDIPVSVVYSDDLISHYEIKTLVSFLKCIFNSYDDINLISTMKSLIGNFSLDEIATIREKFPQEKYFYLACNRYESEIKDNISKKLATMREKLERYKLKSGFVSVYELLSEIIDDNLILEYYSASENGKQLVANIELFLASLKGKKYAENLVDFIDYVDNPIKDSKADLTLENGENSVKLDSIHASKGLEYPVVFVVGCGNNLRKNVSDKIIFDKSVGISTSAYDLDERLKEKSIVENIIKIAKNKSEFEEYIRLLYVALTRAKNNLFIVGTQDIEKIKQINTIFDIYSAKTYMELIIGSLGKENIEKIKNGENYFSLNQLTTGEGEVYVHSDSQVFKKAIKTELMPRDVICNASDEICKKVDEIFNKKYTNEKSVSLALKNTVTEIYTEENNQTNFNFKPKNLSVKENENFSSDALTVGNAYHKVMQFVNYNCLNLQEVNNEIEKMRKENKISVLEKEIIQPEKILSCLEAIRPLVSDANIQREKPFILLDEHKNVVKNSTLSDKVLVQGVVDLIIRKEKEIYVLDFKTTKQSEKILAEEYKTQLEIYSKAVSESFGIPVSNKFIYSFFLDKLIKI